MAGNGSTAPSQVAVNGRAYPYTSTITFDVVVVGAGGAGLRATLGCSHGRPQDRLREPSCSRPAVAHRGCPGRHCSLRSAIWAPDDWRWHMYDTVKGSDWLGDQDAIEYLCKDAPDAVYELEHWGVPFSAGPKKARSISAPSAA